MAADQLSLLSDNILQQVDILLHRGVVSEHGGISLSAHTDGDNVLVFTASLQAVLPVTEQPLLVGIEVPFVAVAGAFAADLVPLLTGAQTGLMVGIPHDNAQHIGKLLVGTARSVQREAGCPHGRPHIVALHTQEKDKNVLIHLRIDAAEMLHRPVAEAGPFIIDKEASKPHARFLGNRLDIPADHRIRTLCGCAVSQIHQGGHTQIFGQGEHTIDGASLVASADDQSRFHPVKRLLHKRYPVNLSLAADRGSIKLSCLLQGVRQRTVSEGRTQNHTLSRRLTCDRGSDIGHQTDIIRNHLSDPFYACVSALFYQKGDCLSRLNQS